MVDYGDNPVLFFVKDTHYQVRLYHDCSSGKKACFMEYFIALFKFSTYLVVFSHE